MRIVKPIAELFAFFKLLCAMDRCARFYEMCEKEAENGSRRMNEFDDMI